MLAAVTIICLVVGIQDGDTLTARCPTQSTAQPYEQVKVRLTGIDAPEKGQPFGQRAKQALSDLTYRKPVRLECNKKDRYQRSVCDVYVAPPGQPADRQTLDAGLALVAQGMAWWYRDYAHEQTPEQRGQYEHAERTARARGIGLWQQANAIPPWQFRHNPPPPKADATGCYTGPRGGRYQWIDGKKRYGC